MNASRMFIIGEFRNKQFYEDNIKSIQKEIAEIDEALETIPAVSIKEVIIENRKPHNMTHVHRAIEKKETLQKKLDRWIECYTNVMVMYNSISDDEIRLFIELLYFKRTPARTVARTYRTSIGSIYYRINNEVDRILKRFY